MSKSPELFLLQGSRNGYSSAIAAAPLQQKDANAISPSELSPPCSTGLVPTPVVSGKAGSKDRNSGRPDASAAAAVLSERKCGAAIWAWAYFLPSFTYYKPPPLSLGREYFPCCPRQPSDHHHAMSSPRRLLVNHKQPAYAGKCILICIVGLFHLTSPYLDIFGVLLPLLHTISANMFSMVAPLIL